MSGLEDMEDIKRLRDYFGENDKTPFEHWAYSFLDKKYKQMKETQKQIIMAITQADQELGLYD